MQVKEITPAQWLLVDAASQYGLDKEHFEDRIEFGKELLPLLEQTDINNPEEISLFLDSYLKNADEPEMFGASLLAIRDVLAGRPTGYMVGLDAASSGPQILSCLTRCITGMSNTGAIDSGDVPDLYTLIKNNMGFEASRKDVKKATVPYVYGSKEAPVNVFGEKYTNFIQAYRTVVPWAEWAKNTLIACWNEHALFNQWELPDGGTAHVRVIGKSKTKGKFLGRQYTYIYNENKTKKKGESGTRSLGAK